jgi:hypothetical protein
MAENMTLKRTKAKKKLQFMTNTSVCRDKVVYINYIGLYDIIYLFIFVNQNTLLRTLNNKECRFLKIHLR